MSILAILTYDGKEFVHHKGLQRNLKQGSILRVCTTPLERCTNENTKGLIRHYIPKRTDVSELSD